MPTDIKLKNSVTASSAPISLQQGEVAINITDKKVWVGNAATTPIQLLGAGASGTFGALTCTSLTNSGLTSGRVTYASTGGLLVDSANMTFNGTTLTVADLTDSSLTANRVVYATTAGNLTTSANLTFNGTTLTTANDASISGLTVGKGGGGNANNTALGNGALAASSGGQCTAIGGSALSLNTGANSTAVGFQALTSNTSGINNDAFGYAALYSNTTGTFNTAVGGYNGSSPSALFANTTGSANIAVGNGALRSNTTASNNTAVGYQSLYLNTTANNNTAVGYQAGYSNTTGADSVFVGRGAGYTATTGSQHTYVGFQAGYSATTGWGNTLIGQAVGYSLTTGSGNTFVGGADGRSYFPCGYFVTTGSHNTILGAYSGNQDSYDMRTLNNRVVISDGAGNRQLTMYEGGTVALDNAVPAAGTGITFPATQSASSDANTLDDYEEGTWTPGMQGGSTAGTWTFSTNQGNYTKIGNLVTVWFNISVSSVSGSPSGTALITGLPFTSASSGAVNSQHTVVADNLGSDCRQMTGQIESGVTYITLLASWGSTGGHSGISATLFNGNESVRGTVIYRV